MEQDARVQHFYSFPGNRSLVRRAGWLEACVDHGRIFFLERRGDLQSSLETEVEIRRNAVW